MIYDRVFRIYAQMCSGSQIMKPYLLEEMDLEGNWMKLMQIYSNHSGGC